MSVSVHEALAAAVKAAVGVAAALPAAVLPAVAVFCARWVLLGAASCLLMGCGPANAALHLAPYLKASPEDGALATLCYGLGSVLGELPAYFVAAELFSSTRRRLERHRYPTGALTWVHGLIGSNGPIAQSPSYPALVLLAAVPAPVDATALLCAVCGTPVTDFLLAALVGKGLIRAHLAAPLYEHYMPAAPAGDAAAIEGFPELFLLTSVVAFAATTLWWRARRGEIDIQLDDEE